MNNQIIPFSFENQQIRSVIRDDTYWFVVKDVMRALEYPITSSPSGFIGHVPAEWKGAERFCTLGGEQNMLCLSEQGLYFFAARSDKEKAIPFQKWLFGEVLPQIRRTGRYGAGADIVEGFLMYQFLDEENKRLTRQIRRYENRNLLTTGDRIDIMTLYVQKYPVSAIQRITKKGRTRIKTFLDGFFALSEEAQDAEIKAWYEAEEGKGGAA
jgi:prophage antirepressor-like protein